MWKTIGPRPLLGAEIAAARRRRFRNLVENLATLPTSRAGDRTLDELSGRLARIAYQFGFLRVDRVAEELMTISKELRSIGVPHSVASHAGHEEPQD
jgi:hypothetical protein